MAKVLLIRSAPVTKSVNNRQGRNVRKISAELEGRFNNLSIPLTVRDVTANPPSLEPEDVQQIAQEGAIQIFQEYNMGMEEVIVGVVGVLQFDVLKYRLENEYNVEIRMDNLPYEHIRWIENEDINMDKIVGTSDMKKIQDLKGRPLLLFVNSWSVGMVLDRNEGLVLSEFGRE